MKRKISIIIFIILLVNIFSILFYNFSFANGKKRNPNSYWSTTNAPIFYGATKITLKKNLLNEFNVFDSRFRIFATDFEDGDLTQKITYSGNVNINEVGTYEITYKVTDFHNNKFS